MDINNLDNTHTDLEEREYVSANIEFEQTEISFEGLNSIKFKVKEKKPNKIVEHVRERQTRGGLF